MSWVVLVLLIAGSVLLIAGPAALKQQAAPRREAAASAGCPGGSERTGTVIRNVSLRGKKSWPGFPIRWRGLAGAGAAVAMALLAVLSIVSPASAGTYATIYGAGSSWA